MNSFENTIFLCGCSSRYNTIYAKALGTLNLDAFLRPFKSYCMLLPLCCVLRTQPWLNLLSVFCLVSMRLLHKVSLCKVSRVVYIILQPAVDRESEGPNLSIFLEEDKTGPRIILFESRLNHFIYNWNRKQILPCFRT